MIGVPYSTVVSVHGPDGAAIEATVTIHFSPPIGMLPQRFDQVLEKELHNAVTRILCKARLTEKAGP